MRSSSANGIRHADHRPGIRNVNIRCTRDIRCGSLGDKFRELGDKFKEFEEKVLTPTSTPAIHTPNPINSVQDRWMIQISSTRWHASFHLFG